MIFLRGPPSRGLKSTAGHNRVVYLLQFFILWLYTQILDHKGGCEMSDGDVPGIDWFEEPIKESVKSVFDGVNAFVESLDLFKVFRSTHFEMLTAQVSGVKILGMQHPVDLKSLYYPASISTNIRRRIYAADWESVDAQPGLRKAIKTKNIQGADSYISKNSKVVILGGPGAGKTTFLKFVALAYSDRTIFNKTKLAKSQLPIYLHLPQVARDECKILDAICRPLTERKGKFARDFYTRLIEHGECTLLLDSLDEVPVAARRALIQRINDFTALYPKCRVVISCRTADYDQAFTEFSEVELSRLKPEAVESIVNAWFNRDRERAEKLLTLLQNDESVSSLTETPLLLSLLCIQFKNDLALPKKKTELYRRCVDALIRDWDTTRGFRRDTAYSQLSDDRKEKIFEAVAGAACADSINYELSEAFVLREISNEISRFSLDANDAKGILLEIENHHGILEKCSVETYEFSHGTMQEYFAARYFVAKRLEMDVLRKHYDDEEWHNVIAFVVSILDDPSEVLNFLVAKSRMTSFQNYPAFGKRLVHLLLLYRCMAIGVSISVSLRHNICTHLVESQVQMLRHLNRDGIYPFAARIQSGVRQALFSSKKSRASLTKILQPYRRLMNEIVLSPVKEYAEVASNTLDEILSVEGTIYGNVGIVTCLICPISDVKPKFFLVQMIAHSKAMQKLGVFSAVRSVIEESITHQKIAYPEIQIVLAEEE